MRRKQIIAATIVIMTAALAVAGSQSAVLKITLLKGSTLSEGKEVPGTLVVNNKIIPWVELPKAIAPQLGNTNLQVLIEIDAEATTQIVHFVATELKSLGVTNVSVIGSDKQKMNWATTSDGIRQPADGSPKPSR